MCQLDHPEVVHGFLRVEDELIMLSMFSLPSVRPTAHLMPQ